MRRSIALLGLLSLARIVRFLVHLAVLSLGVLFVLLVANNFVYKVLLAIFACYSARIEVCRVLNHCTDLNIAAN